MEMREQYDGPMSKATTLKLLRFHGLDFESPVYVDIDGNEGGSFLEDFGDRDSYDYHEVLNWLGY